MKILFVNLSGLVFTVATPDTAPLGGTESAMCYLARELAKRGHGVFIVGKQPDNSPLTVMGVTHTPLNVLQNSDFLAAQEFDVIIVSNAPVAGTSLRAMSPQSHILLWNHLAPDHASVGHLRYAEARDSFDSFVYVSRWQHEMTEKLFGFAKKSSIIGNGFAPAFAHMFSSVEDLMSAKENRAAYTTTPFRGLPILLDAMTDLGTDTRLDIYSSMKVYQATTEDDQFAKLYSYASQLPNVSNHGAVAQSELAERLKPVSFFTYPSTYPETFCIAALEARAAGMKVLTTASAALPELLGKQADYIPVNIEKPQEMITNFRAMLRGNAERFRNHRKEWAEERFADLQHVNRHFTWAERAKEWEQLLSQHI